jgi:hypothetical protein
MRMKGNPVWTLSVLLLVVTLLAQGCATKALWSEKHYHPARPTNLELSARPDRQMVLVQYDEQYEDSRKIQRRAYWLDLNDRYPITERPIFLKTVDPSGLQPIPILPEITATNAMPQTGYAARMVSNHKRFELWQDGAPIAEFMLPEYDAKAPADFYHVAVTPFAVVADGIIIVGGVAVIAGVVYLVAQDDEE